jgi:2-iminobutanoate/2-iminopropanoate deaminase
VAKPVGHYSPFVKAGDFVVTSGQIGIDDTGALVSKEFEDQARQTLNNVKEVLADAGMQITDVVKVTVFITDMKDWPTFNDMYAQFFGDHKPARSTVAVNALPAGARIEMEAWACRS